MTAKVLDRPLNMHKLLLAARAFFVTLATVGLIRWYFGPGQSVISSVEIFVKGIPVVQTLVVSLVFSAILSLWDSTIQPKPILRRRTIAAWILAGIVAGLVYSFLFPPPNPLK